MFRTGVLLGLFAVAGTALIAFTYDNTADRIAAEEREFLLHSIQELLPPSRFDNDLYNDLITVTDPKLLGSKDPIPVYRARKDGKPVAVVMEPVAPDGYGGAIKLLVVIGYDGSIVGVRVLNHQRRIAVQTGRPPMARQKGRRGIRSVHRGHHHPAGGGQGRT
jgi:electron transport complex protein RnfG